mgnify:CR=1 FL=1
MRFIQEEAPLLNKFREHFLTVRIVKFAIVGGLGILVNMGLLYIFTEAAKLNYKLSSVIAIEISIITNFLINDAWTWKDRIKERFFSRMLRYHVSAGITATVFNWGLLVLLTEVFGVYYLLSNIAGISIGTISNYILNNFWTFKNRV